MKEELIFIPSVRESKLLKQDIYLDKKEWRNFREQVRYMQMELERALYRAYHLQYDEEYQETEQEPAAAHFEFNDYIKMVCASYDADEFERTSREMFEDIFSDGLDAEIH